MDSNIWTHQYWLTNKNLHQLCANTECRIEDLLETMDDWEEVARESKEIPCYQHNNEDDDDDINLCGMLKILIFQ